MARRHPKPKADLQRTLQEGNRYCWECNRFTWTIYHNRRTLITLEGLVELTLPIRACRNPDCPAYRKPRRPAEEATLALPQTECGLDVIAFVGACRYQHYRSVPEIHRLLLQRGVSISERTVTNLLARYEELVALRLSDQTRLQTLFKKQGKVVLAFDGMQPDVGHEVLWVFRDLLSGEVLLARSLLSGATLDMAALLREVKAALPVPVVGIVSDGQSTLREAVAQVFPGLPHQLCQFHYLREAAKPIFEADRHAKKLLKQQVRGVRPLEREVEGRTDPEAVAAYAYAQAIRSALTDDGHPPLSASGVRLRRRLQAISDSLARAQQAKGGAGPG